MSRFDRPNPDQWRKEYFAAGPDGIFALEIWTVVDGDDSVWVLVYGEHHTPITDEFAATLLRDGVFTTGGDDGE